METKLFNKIIKDLEKGFTTLESCKRNEIKKSIFISLMTPKQEVMYHATKEIFKNKWSSSSIDDRYYTSY